MAEHVIAERYRLLSVLGRGGMATVWRAVDERLGRPVAVKLLDEAGAADPAAVRRFEQEAQTAARLNHPNIVAVHDAGHDRGRSYLVMELVEGTSLVAELNAGPLPVDRAVAVAAQVCDALGAAHAHGIVHRDVKPANILLTGDGTAKVCDFGIARLIHHQRADLTAARTAIGTSGFMAPEQATGGPIDARTDLYAVGCLLFAMLAGRPPFVGDTSLAVLHQHVHERPAAVRSLRPDVPADLDRLVTDLLAKRPEDRPASAGDVRDRLTATRAGHPTGAGQARLAGGAHVPGAGSVVGADPVAGPYPAAGGYRAGRVPVAGGVSHTSAAVGLPTRAMRLADEPPTARPRRPVVALLALAVAAVTVGAVGVAVFLATQRPAGNAGANAGPSATASTTAPAPPAPSNTPGASPTTAQVTPVSALRATIDEQTRAGELDVRAAKELAGKLDDVERELARNRLDKAAEKLADLQEKLDELRDDRKIGRTAYHAIRVSLDQVAETLPPPDN
jgi:serine/threonine-protein kinase